jgi:hypothetical protein
MLSAIGSRRRMNRAADFSSSGNQAVSVLRLILIAAPIIVFLGYYTFYPPNTPLINPDSDGYLRFSAYRTGGYPFFLDLLKPIIRDVSDYALAQRVLFASAVFVLAFQVLRSFGSLLLTAFVEFMLLGIPQVNAYHFQIFTESLFLSTSAFFLAATLSHLRSGSWPSLAIASALSGYAITIRPVGLAFVPAVAGLLLLAPRSSLSKTIWVRLFAAVAPLLFVLLFENLFYHARHPGPRESLLATQMFGKAGMIDVNNPSELIGSSPAVTKPLQIDLELNLAPVRHLISGTPNLPARCWLLQNYETFVGYRFAIEERAALASTPNGQTLGEIAWSRLRHGGPDYIRLSFDHWRCLWTLSSFYFDELDALNSYVDNRRPLPLAQALPDTPLFSNSPASRITLFIRRAGMIAGGLLLAFSIGTLLVQLIRRREPSQIVTVSALCGVVVHGGFVLSALGSVGIPRYAIGLWVPFVLGSCLSMLWLFNAVNNVVCPNEGRT